MVRYLYLLCLLLGAACTTGTGDPTPSPTPTEEEHVFYRVSETGFNMQLTGRKEFDAAGDLISITGSMSLSYRYQFETRSESGSQSSNCWTNINESGQVIEEAPGDLPWGWLLQRTLVSDSCFIGLNPAEVTYAWDPADPTVLWSNRYTILEDRYLLDPALTFTTGDLDPPGSGSFEEVSVTGGGFTYTQGDL